MKIPDHFTLQYSEAEIQSRILTLVSEIKPWIKEVEIKDRHLLVAPIMKGGLFFFVDLIRALDELVEVGFLKASSYQPGEVGVQHKEIKLDLEGLGDVKGRHVLLVDEICDSGRTLNNACSAILELGATEVRTAVLVRRITNNSLSNPDWCGFNYSGQEWFVGYGLQERGLYRQLKELYTIRSA